VGHPPLRTQDAGTFGLCSAMLCSGA